MARLVRIGIMSLCTYASRPSNSSLFLCLLKNAAARFLTSLASRLLRPLTSGGMKSLVEMGPEGGARDFFAGAGEAEELLHTDDARVNRAAVECGEMEHG